MDQIVSQLETCVTNQDVDSGKPLLNQVKVVFLTASTTNNVTELPVAAKGLECGVLLSLMEGDLEAFSRFLSLLLPYYTSTSTASADATSQQRQYLVIGLHLMHLLVEHRLSEFHSVLELLDGEQVSSNSFLSYPVGLERQLMVGLYDEIMSTPIPDPSYQFFVDNYLQQTLRDNIADGMEVSYTALTLEEAAQRMKFESIAELEEYVQEYRDDWILTTSDSGVRSISFAPVDTTVSASDIAAQDWIQQSLQYATEMERIV
mmetsp:Transcript_15694/g.43280  ORF Transcript_15694/g.43280 Transcript_15694/m.43280 type:complete len:261 (-) Transcript_15694:141-923(-)